MKIFQGFGYIDFYVDKVRFEKYKSRRAKFNYVHTCLVKYFNKFKGVFINNILIKDIFITSNNFWGIEDFLIINDIGFSGYNPVELREDKITIRIFNIEILGLCEEVYDLFFELKTDNFLIQVGSSRLI